MEISPVISQYLQRPDIGPQQELKVPKGPASDQDIQRFDSFMGKESTFHPKEIETIGTATEKNAVQNLGGTIFDKVKVLKESMDSRMNKMTHMVQDVENLSTSQLLSWQWELSRYSLESNLIAKSASKTGEGIKILFRNQ